MAYSEITTTEIGNAKPLIGPAGTGTKIRENFIDHESRLNAFGVASDNAIHDDFFGAIGTAPDPLVNNSVLSADTWQLSLLNAGVAEILANHTLRLSGGNGNAAALGASLSKMRPIISEEYVIVVDFRMKASGSQITDYFLGLNDNGVTLGTNMASDITDCIGFYIKNSGQWTYRQANGGTATESVDVVSIANFATAKMTVTCSATAGSRKVVLEVNGSTVGTFTTNLPTARLRPVIAVSGNGATADHLLSVDYFKAYPTARPLAP